ncbi:phosphoenolpyruvate--protein phosphotransferase [Ancylobacter lacus]|uniref:phosphoenolpyruvate--protein phosphotransferase n=1 Tax=Ancylobacter lacus TaxID=2579970 RepID=UPI001BCEA226|nr:putative PEP-binding protein [Ancylobacter lacus]MBS7537813.1 phosphoenolpyruvate--protein phosphotransferase [Ancylobacter lacus]
MSETRLQGRSASPGLAAGPVVLLAAPRAAARPALDPDAAAGALRRAMSRAAGEIAALVATSEPAAADMLGFQLALLEDDALAEGAFHAISLGVPAELAWQQALDAEIAGYEAAEDEYFRARAADLMDVRDRVLDALAGGDSGAGSGAAASGIVAAHDLPPSRFLGMDWSAGGAILLAGGSPTSHVAMLARSRGIPMIVGLGVAPEALLGEVLVDATAGAVVIDPSPETRRAFERQRELDGRRAATEAAGALEPAVTRDGTPVAVLLNVADPAELDGLDPALCDGIGLVRTEFLFHDAGALPGEEAQRAVYARILAWACRDGRARPVTIRTLDAGGDKPIAGLTVEGESNPFLGVRGIRLSLAREEVFRVQLRALLRAAAGPGGTGLKVMLPMVTVPAEVARTRALLAQELAALAAAGLPAALPALGIMIEVPAAAIAIDLFEADFYSVGSNDLTQYVTAAGRDIGALADLADPLNPAVLRLVERVAQDGAARGREVSLCGDAGGDPAALPALLRTGLRALSMAPGLVPAAKAALRAVDLAGGRGR